MTKVSSESVVKELANKYNDLIWTEYPIPADYKGKGQVKAIILGADPTHIVDGKPVQITSVFNINEKNSPYWRGISRNLLNIRSLTEDNIYVQNVCRNYFKLETSKNKQWTEIARNYWIPFLAEELNDMFHKEVPVLMTTEFILRAAIVDKVKLPKAGLIYSECMSIPAKENMFDRELIAFYRHPNYSLKRWEDYRGFVENRFNRH